MTQIAMNPPHKAASVKQPAPEPYTYAAWSFANSMLWQYDRLTESEIEAAEKHLRQYFEDEPDKYDALVRFCEAVILRQRKHFSRVWCFVDKPSIWFWPNNLKGFAGALNAHRAWSESPVMTNMRREIILFAEGYAQFAIHGDTERMLACRAEFFRTGGYELIPLLNNAVFNHTYNIPYL